MLMLPLLRVAQDGFVRTLAQYHHITNSICKNSDFHKVSKLLPPKSLTLSVTGSCKVISKLQLSSSESKSKISQKTKSTPLSLYLRQDIQLHHLRSVQHIRLLLTIKLCDSSEIFYSHLHV